MKTALLLAGLLALFANPRPLHAQDNRKTEARRLALELAGAFSNDGFRLRDGHWCETVAAGRPRLVEVNLHAGNLYWFSLASADPSIPVTLTVYDETGRLMEGERLAEPGRAAAAFAPKTSGPYYLKVDTSSPELTTFCLLYSYR